MVDVEVPENPAEVGTTPYSEFPLADGNILRGAQGRWHVGDEHQYYGTLFAAYASTFRGKGGKEQKLMTLVEFAEQLKSEKHITLLDFYHDDFASTALAISERCQRAYEEMQGRTVADPNHERTLEAIRYLMRESMGYRSIRLTLGNWHKRCKSLLG